MQIKLKNKFYKKYFAGFSDCDYKYNVTLSAILRWTGEIAGFHLDDRGITREQMWNEDEQVFLLTKFALYIENTPKYSQTITISTWELESKGAQFGRNFAGHDSDGNFLFDAMSLWILVNPHTHQILRPKAYKHEILHCDDTPIALIEKIDTNACELVGDRIFRYTDIDANGHVFNAKYADIAYDFAPYDFMKGEIKKANINFLHEAVLEDKVNIYTKCNDKQYVAYSEFDNLKRNFEAQIEMK